MPQPPDGHILFVLGSAGDFELVGHRGFRVADIFERIDDDEKTAHFIEDFLEALVALVDFGAHEELDDLPDVVSI